jgi:hypothetical protein
LFAAIFAKPATDLICMIFSFQALLPIEHELFDYMARVHLGGFLATPAYRELVRTGRNTVLLLFYATKNTNMDDTVQGKISAAVAKSTFTSVGLNGQKCASTAVRKQLHIEVEECQYSDNSKHDNVGELSKKQCRVASATCVQEDCVGINKHQTFERTVFRTDSQSVSLKDGKVGAAVPENVSSVVELARAVANNSTAEAVLQLCPDPTVSQTESRDLIKPVATPDLKSDHALNASSTTRQRSLHPLTTSFIVSPESPNPTPTSPRPGIPGSAAYHRHSSMDSPTLAAWMARRGTLRDSPLHQHCFVHQQQAQENGLEDGDASLIVAVDGHTCSPISSCRGRLTGDFHSNTSTGTLSCPNTNTSTSASDAINHHSVSGSIKGNLKDFVKKTDPELPTVDPADLKELKNFIR